MCFLRRRKMGIYILILLRTSYIGVVLNCKATRLVFCLANALYVMQGFNLHLTWALCGNGAVFKQIAPISRASLWNYFGEKTRDLCGNKRNSGAFFSGCTRRIFRLMLPENWLHCHVPKTSFIPLFPLYAVWAETTERPFARHFFPAD